MLIARTVFVVAVGALAINCSPGSKDLKPDHYGAFVVSRGKLIELKHITGLELGKRNMNHVLSDIPNSIPADKDAYFITYGDVGDEPLLLPASQEGQVYRVDVDKKLELQISPIKGEEKMRRLQPAVPLSVGTYDFSYDGCPDNGADFRCYTPIQVK